MKTIAMFAGAALLSLGLAGNAAAADGAALYASKGCAACHGADGKTPIMPVYPKLAGQNAQYALNQMKDIKSGARNNGQTAAMKGIVMSVSEEELQAIAEWLAAQ
ncbi:c-type cytochrome [Sedimenticola selenatireducens]|uniref:Cytochrome C n=1 Tax=Sedimenticola selenatireducens TaxID=191960 RepID=A0A2N6CVS1_9GAMM|nr:c-type cytochrome [Sedimenticola selenatireducens]PLX61323.1 MAG: cytochrome C [Sedimenticola selenatireducens]